MVYGSSKRTYQKHFVVDWQDNMSDSIQFSALAAGEFNHPACPLCTENAVEFEFHFTSDCRPMEQLRGRCCLSCAVALLDAMHALTTAEEEQFQSGHHVMHCASKYVN